MLKIHQLFVFKFLILLFSTLFLTSTISYLFLEKNLIKSHQIELQNILNIVETDLESQKNLRLYLQKTSEKTMSDFYSLWIILGVILTLIVLMSFYIAKSMASRIEHDINELREYLNAISNKNYEAHIRIKYYQEFLEISVLLKNLIKRLNNREKKVVKKSIKK